MPVKLTEDMVKARSKGSDLYNIRKLNCWGSELSDISVVRKLENVEVLSLSVNQISSLEDFQWCANLQELYIRKNIIKDINELLYLRELPKLKSLWLADNPCAEFEKYRLTVLRALPHLQKLDNVMVEGEEVQQAMVTGVPLPLGGGVVESDGGGNASDYSPPATRRVENGYTTSEREYARQQQQRRQEEQQRLAMEQRRKEEQQERQREEAEERQREQQQRQQEQQLQQRQQEQQLQQRQQEQQRQQRRPADQSVSPQRRSVGQSPPRRPPPEDPAPANAPYMDHRGRGVTQQYQERETAWEGQGGAAYSRPESRTGQGGAMRRYSAGAVTHAYSPRRPEGPPRQAYPARPKTRSGNVLSAVLCLVKELDLMSLEVAEMAIRCRMDELDD